MAARRPSSDVDAAAYTPFGAPTVWQALSETGSPSTAEGATASLADSPILIEGFDGGVLPAGDHKVRVLLGLSSGSGFAVARILDGSNNSVGESELTSIGALGYYTFRVQTTDNGERVEVDLYPSDFAEMTLPPVTEALSIEGGYLVEP